MADWQNIRETINFIKSLPKLPENDSEIDPLQDYWAQDSWGGKVSDLLGIPSYEIEGACGTAACLAGWKTKLDGVRPGYMSSSWHAQEAWGLTEHQADALFWYNNSIEDMERMVDTWEEEENL